MIKSKKSKKAVRPIYSQVIYRTDQLPEILREVFNISQVYNHCTVVVSFDQGSGVEMMSCRSTDYIGSVRDLYRMLPFSEWWFDRNESYTRWSTVYRQLRRELRYFVDDEKCGKLIISVVEKF